ncbi:MAG: acyl-ACP--UDP-N-acetylglucosamine O-acyltransferase [Candidatus Omnitrophota bacterium]
MKIHETAIIHPKAQVADSVIIGPYSVIGENVTIKENTVIGAHCVVDGWTTIGSGNKIFTGAILGSPPQDRKYKGEKSFTIIGDNNIIREYITMNPATEGGEKTIIGSRNMIMAYSHIAHNCVVGNDVVIANAGTLAGHVTIEDGAIIGGMVAVHQFVRVGKLSIIGGCSKVVQDIPPFSTCDGHPARAYGLNSVGLKRAGISPKERLEIKNAFKILFFSHLSFGSSVEQVKQLFPDSEFIAYLVDFITASQRGVCRGCKE